MTTLDLKSHLSHALFVSLYEFCAVLLPILYDTRITCSLCLRTCTTGLQLLPILTIAITHTMITH